MSLEISDTSPTEIITARIGEIMASLLRVKQVTTESDFFALGGNSLLGAQLAYQIQREYRIDLGVKDIFEAKTPGRITELLHARMNGALAAHVGLRAAGAPAAVIAQPTRPIPTEAVPITAQQRSIWLLEQNPAGKAISNVAIVFSYRGLLDGARLEAAVRELVDRHPALRTTYAKQGATVVQRARKFVSVPQRFVDLSDLPPDERNASLQEIQTEEISRPFDLERDAMVRLTHVRLEAEAGVLLFLFHHIAVDDRSLEIFFEQLAALYAADDARSVPHAGRSFLDYCQEEAAAEAEGDRAETVAYWRAQLRGMDGTAYPSRGGPRSERSTAGRHHYHALPPALTEAIDRAAARCSTTPFGIFIAGVTYLLHRATGCDDVCLASLMSRRDRFSDADVIGCFVNTVPLRTHIDRGWTLEQLTKSVVDTFVDAYAHRHVAFEEMVEEAELREGNRGRALPVTINFEAEKVEELSLGDARLRREPLDRRIAKRDLVLSLRKVDGTYRILVEHRADLYGPDEVALLTENLEAALDQLTSDPAALVGTRWLAPPRAVPALASALGWSTVLDYEPMPIHALFQRAKQGREDKTALVGSSGALSYGALDERSDAVASALAMRGVGPGDVVAVIESRHVETIAALLGVSKAGAAYVVLGASQPQAQLERIVHACRPVVLLGRRRALEGLPALGVPVLATEDACAAPISPAVQRRSKEIDPGATAYVCFTSGSGGAPKGVAVSHGSITRVLQRTSYAAISAADVFLNISPLGFDGSVFEIWAPLANGGTLRLMHDGALSLDEIAAAIVEGRVSLLFVTTQLFNALVDRKREALLGVPTILFGGEKASPEHVERLVAAGYAGNLRNIYGPTEATVFATSHAVSKDSLRRNPGDVPIGRAHNHTSLAVIDDQLRLVPCGVVGELAIGGPGVANGYVNDAELTAAKFVRLALPGGLKGRFYRSGDLVYCDTDGDIHFVGRKDRQVKISGYRIELDEVETVVGRAPGVTGCHCLAGEELVAFVGHDEQRTTGEDIKAYVRSQLPAYKVPHRFVFLAQLPLNRNGKIDVEALAELARRAGGSAAPAPAPALDLAAIVREVWRKELNNDAFSDDDTFFDVGGTSLKIMLVHDELSKILHERGYTGEIEITHLFEFTTVASLAEFLEGSIHGPRR
jgi:amino acid adenylation domain-containing protein